jgi:hypothetical protein
MPIVCGVMIMVPIVGCSTVPPPKPQPTPVSQQSEKPWCESSCPEGYRCSDVRVAGILTGLCVQGPTQCTSDADCQKVSFVPGTKPMHYVCDKRSGAFPDKTGGTTMSDRGTCLPDQSTALGTH